MLKALRAQDPIATDPAFDGERRDLRALAQAARWAVVLALRHRIDEVERSVHDALADEQGSPEAYLALRSYPARLMSVERLAASLPVPVLGSTPPRQDDRVARELRGAGDEAQEASARLSRLISSQQVVVAKQQALAAQRQADETQRFQRLSRSSAPRSSCPA